jgi:signal transduction histidine kinase
VAERTASLEQTLAQMEEFTYSISHDLRAPARIIRGMSEAALEDFGATMQPELRNFVERTLHSAQRMERLVSDILDYSRVARNEVRLAPVSLEKLVPAIIADRPDMQPPKADIRIRAPLAQVLAYEPALSQAITNLLANAVKFVPAGVHPNIEVWTELVKAKGNDSHERATLHQPPASNGHASINSPSSRAGVTEEDSPGPDRLGPLNSRQPTINQFVRLWVKDNGIGVSPKYHQRLFNLFERAHDSAQYAGTGVGLAIVRKAAEKMGGKVGVVSDGQSGSSFWIELPALCD